MTTKTVRIGMLSFAHMHAHSYASCLQQLPQVELVGIYDEDSDRGMKTAVQFGTAFYAEAQTLLNEKLDGVVICSENVKHRSLVELAAGQTAAILCEKPIATTMADAQAMIDVCAARNTRLQIAFPVRFSPTIQRLKVALDEAQLGKLHSVKCTNHGQMPGGWFVDKAQAGGGAVMDHTVHVIDVLRWLWDTEVTEVYAEVGSQLLHADVDIDDAGLLSFKLANGVYGTLDTSWSRPSSYPIWGDVRIEVLGMNGLIQTDAFSQNVSVSSNATGKMSWVGWGSNADLGLIKDFVEMIREDRAPSITGYDGLKAMEVALAAYESARRGELVQLT